MWKYLKSNVTLFKDISFVLFLKQTCDLRVLSKSPKRRKREVEVQAPQDDQGLEKVLSSQ